MFSQQIWFQAQRRKGAKVAPVSKPAVSADFQIGGANDGVRFADLEIRDTADLKVCATFPERDCVLVAVRKHHQSQHAEWQQRSEDFEASSPYEVAAAGLRHSRAPLRLCGFAPWR